MAKDSGLDDVLAAIGFGRWQLPVLILTILAHVVIPIHMMGSALLSAPVEFKCMSSAPGGFDDSNASSLNMPVLSENHPFVMDDQNLTLVTYDSKCLGGGGESGAADYPEGGLPCDAVLVRNMTVRPTGLPSCPWVAYDESVFTSTIISEFDLICEKEKLRPLFQMMYSIGALVGSLLLGYVTDGFGRKVAVQIATVMNLSAAVCFFIMPWYLGLLAARVLVGTSCNFLIIPAYSLVLEITPPKYRTMAGMLLGTAFSVGIVIFAGIGYFIRSWRYLLLLASSAPLLIIFPLAFWIDESPRWLIQHGRSEEVFKMLTRAAERNRVKQGSILVDFMKRIENITIDDGGDLHQQQQNFWSRVQSALYGFGAYFRSRSMRVILIITPLLWILQGCLYLGIILNANNFTSNNPFIYIAVSGMIDLSAVLLATPLSIRFGRRFLISFAFFVAGAFIMVDILVPTEYLWIKWMLVMSALMLVAGAFQINFLYAPELFPTVIRARGFALASLAGNLGSLVAPLITDILYQKAWWFVSLSFGSAGIMGSLLVPLLPETNKRPLPDTIEDVEERHRRNTLKKSMKKQRKYDIELPDEKDEEETEECKALTPS